MNETPHELMNMGREPENDFTDEEELYRAVKPQQWPALLEAITLPDMSVNRSKYGKHPEWVLLFEGRDGWGVLSFQVGDIPPTLEHLGAFSFTFRMAHMPDKHNRAHSEVHAYTDGTHIDLKNQHLLPHSVLLRWRHQLMCKVQKRIHPTGS
jgi:hypothetical protein